MIIRGTTQTQCFRVPYNWTEISKCYISYQVQNKLVLEKSKKDIYYSKKYNAICVDLTEEDTLAFPEVGLINRPKDSLILIQIRILTTSGEAYASPIIRDRLKDIIKKTNISDIPDDGDDDCDCDNNIIIIYDGGDISQEYDDEIIEKTVIYDGGSI